MRTIWAIYRADLRRAHRSLHRPRRDLWTCRHSLAIHVVQRRGVLGSLRQHALPAYRYCEHGCGIQVRSGATAHQHRRPGRLCLRKNDKFDWVIASEEAAVEGTRSGDYYAAIVIPEDFSKDMLTFFDGEASSAPMTYYVNEKKNGISPKLAGQGAEFVSAQVNQTFAQTLAEVALDTASSMGDALSSTTATGAVTTLDNRVQSVATRLRTAADSADAYAALASSSLTLIDSTTTLVSGVGTAKSSAQSAVGSADSGATGLTAAATGAIASVSSAIDSSRRS